jgi:hypothetical protein
VSCIALESRAYDMETVRTIRNMVVSKLRELLTKANASMSATASLTMLHLTCRGGNLKTVKEACLQADICDDMVRADLKLLRGNKCLVDRRAALVSSSGGVSINYYGDYLSRHVSV